MKVFLYYEDNEISTLHKTLKITLPKSWKSGPTSRLLKQFVESYNASSLGDIQPLNEEELHLAMMTTTTTTTTTIGSMNVDKKDDPIKMIPSDAIIETIIPDRANVFIRHGEWSITVERIELEKKKETEKALEYKASTVKCTHLGCNTRFPKGGPYPPCRYHIAPPVFHETAKFWSCCPDKKAYDWNDFETIQGCQTGVCTEVKQDETDQKQFLGGSDLREKTQGAQLKSIDDFNKAQVGGEAAPVLDRLERVMIDLGIEKELYDQVVNGIKQQKLKSNTTTSTVGEAELLEEVKSTLGSQLKSAMKAIAVEQLRIS